MLPDHGIGARRVHDAELAQQLGGMGALEQIRLQRPLGDLGAVAQQVDAVGGGGDPLGKHALAEQGIDETRLAGVELAGDHQQEQPGELLGRLLEPLEVGRLHVLSESLQGAREAPQQLLLPGPQILLAVRQERSPPEQPPYH